MDEHILRRFKRIHDYLEKNGNNALKEYGLTLAQGHVIGYLKHCDSNQAPFKELERTMKVAQSTTVGIVARLEHGGFVSTFSNETDKRIKIVSLTKKGEELADEIHKQMIKMRNEILKPLTKEEIAQFDYLMSKITQNM